MDLFSNHCGLDYKMGIRTLGRCSLHPWWIQFRTERGCFMNIVIQGLQLKVWSWPLWRVWGLHIAQDIHITAYFLYSTCHRISHLSDTSFKCFLDSLSPWNITNSGWRGATCPFTIRGQHWALSGKRAQESVFEWMFMIQTLFLFTIKMPTSRRMTETSQK